jgi:inorganic triphosphatase YgiF
MRSQRSKVLMSDARESEVKYVVTAPDPQHVVRSIASFRKLDGFALAPGEPLSLRDAYFDSVDRRLSGAGLAVRVRRANDEVLLALKGSNDAPVGALPSRLELEMRWSDVAAKKLQAALDSFGIRTSPPKTLASPEQYLAGLGLRLLIARRTRRLVRHLLHGHGSRRPFGEMALDRVDDTVDSMVVRHWEVEIEASSEQDREEVSSASRELMRRVGSGLRPFSGSKLGIGLALRELRNELTKGKLIDQEGRLTAKGLNAVERTIRDGAVTGSGTPKNRSIDP